MLSNSWRLAPAPLVLVLGLLSSLPAAHAQICTFAPQAANDQVDNHLRPFIVDPLANDSDPDGQALSLAVRWGSTTCAAQVTPELGLFSVVPSTTQFEDCTIAYRVTDEDGLTADAVIQVTTHSDLIFADGFETGASNRWSSCAGTC